MKIFNPKIPRYLPFILLLHRAEQDFNRLVFFLHLCCIVVGFVFGSHIYFKFITEILSSQDVRVEAQACISMKSKEVNTK